MSERGDGDMLVVNEAVCQQVIDQTAVSYTHLTLPTILLV